MLILIGPSASGKTEVAKLLAKKYNITKIVTYTTRAPRVNEVNGVDYNFVSVEEFAQPTLGSLIKGPADYGKIVDYSANGITRWQVYYETDE